MAVHTRHQRCPRRIRFVGIMLKRRIRLKQHNSRRLTNKFFNGSLAQETLKPLRIHKPRGSCWYPTGRGTDVPDNVAIVSAA